MKKQFVGCRTSNVVVLTEMLQVESFFFGNDIEHYVRQPSLRQNRSLTDPPGKLRSHLSLTC